jgi:hypothetical protein
MRDLDQEYISAMCPPRQYTPTRSGWTGWLCVRSALLSVLPLMFACMHDIGPAELNVPPSPTSAMVAAASALDLVSMQAHSQLICSASVIMSDSLRGGASFLITGDLPPMMIDTSRCGVAPSIPGCGSKYVAMVLSEVSLEASNPDGVLVWTGVDCP